MKLSPAPCGSAVRRGTRLGAVTIVVGLALGALGALAGPALAADPQLTVTLSQRWQLGGTQGTWTPYVVTIRDEGPASFAGDVYLRPNDAQGRPPAAYPTYHASVSVARGGERSTSFYVVDAPDGYQAEVRDSSDHVVARAGTAPSAGAGAAMGILSDLPQAEQKISAPLRALSRVDASLARFPSPQAFPTNAVYLTGLSGVVVDQFDSAALSQAQVQALEDFIGLGGTLIEAGGPSWRRTLLSLPPGLLPMRPTATGTASLASLGELAGLATDATAQIATGEVGAASVAVATPEGLPLMVEAAYGAGRIVELAFDPFGEPFDTQVQLAGVAWAQAISRALSGVRSGGRALQQTGFGVSTGISATGGAGTGPGSWAPGYGAGADQLYQILNDTPASASPPVGLLGGLLVAYVLLAGLLNYLFTKSLGRRALMWVSVPAVAIAFTAGAYAVGFGTRGSDFLVTEMQVQRLAPGGAVESYTFDGVYAPRKGDVRVGMPANTLVSTAVVLGGLGDTNGQALITVGSRPEVLLGNVAVWSMRPVQTLSVTHPFSYEPRASMPVEARLSLRKGRVEGQVVNRGPRPVSDVELVSASGAEAVLTSSLAPGASVPVDVDLAAGPAGSIATSRGTARPIPGVSENARQGMVRLASTEALSSRPGELALVGFTEATDSIRIEGVRPGRSGAAAIVEPLDLQSADSLTGIGPRARLVSNYVDASGAQVDTYEFDLPPGLAYPTGLNYQMLDTPQSNVSSVEVYDFDRHGWRALPAQTAAGSPGPAPLRAGEVRQGVVRVRVREGFPGQANLSVSDQQ